MKSFRVLRIAGIDIFINWSWLLALAFITWSLGDFYHVQFRWSAGAAYTVGIISAVLLFGTVLLHELAHSLTARSLGLPVNSITLFIFGGVSNLTREPDNPRTEFLVAIAGPLTSLVLAGIFYVLHVALTGLPQEVAVTLGYLASVNLILGIFNLIPGFPLDGGRVFRSIVWMLTHSLRRATHIASNVGQAIGYLLILAGLVEALVLNQFISGLWLAFIGWYLHNAAGASYQQAVMEGVLRGVDVRDLMDPAPVSVPAWTTIDALVYHHMLNENQRAIPVSGRDGAFEGLVTLADVRHLPRDQWNTTQVSQIMTPASRLRNVTPGTDLRTAMQILAENSYHQLPVMDEERLVGMLNRGHVLQWLHMREQLNARGEGKPPAGSVPTNRRQAS